MLRCGAFGRCNGRYGVNANLLLVARVGRKSDNAIDLRVDCVVATQADIIAGLDLGAALAHNDSARPHNLTAIALDAKHLRLAVATIARAADAFLMCHIILLVSMTSNERRTLQLLVTHYYRMF